MKPFLSPLMLALLPFLFVGCSSVLVSTPIAPPEKVFTPEQVDGAWLLTFDQGDATNRVVVDVRMFEDHVLKAAIIHWEQKDPLIISFRGHFFKIGEQAYLQLRSADEHDVIQFFMVKNVGEGRGELRLANQSMFEEAVAKKELKGRTTSHYFGSEVRLEDGNALAAYLKKHGEALFYKEFSYSLKRLD